MGREPLGWMFGLWVAGDALKVFAMLPAGTATSAAWWAATVVVPVVVGLVVGFTTSWLAMRWGWAPVAAWVTAMLGAGDAAGTVGWPDSGVEGAHWVLRLVAWPSLAVWFVHALTTVGLLPRVEEGATPDASPSAGS